MIRDLGDGLVLRRATTADIEALAAFTADVLRYQDADAPDERTAAWTRDLMDGQHPAVHVEDFLVVDDTRRRRLASCTALIAQTWLYGGLQISVGQIDGPRLRRFPAHWLFVGHRASALRGAR
jgi:hypothetical protein